MLYTAAFFYVLIFWYVGYKNPRVPLMLIIALSPFQNDMSGGGPLRFSMAEINMLLTVPLLLFTKRRSLTLGPYGPSIIFYLLVSLGCTLINWRYTSLICLVQMVLYLVIGVLIFYALPRSEADYRFALDGLMVVTVAMAGTVLAKRTGYVWGLHKNGVGSSLGAALIVCTELWFASSGRRRKVLSGALVIIAGGLFFTLSRGAWLGAIVGIGILIALRREFKLLLRLNLVLVPLIAICWAHLPESSKDYATGFSSDNFNIKMRFKSVDIARELFDASPWIGNGVGLRKEYDATNLIWCTLAETGVIGLFALLLMHEEVLRITWKTQKNLDRRSVLYSGVALGGALVFSRFIHGMVDHYWGRGPNTVVWAAVGMALYGYNAKRKALLAAHRRALMQQSLLNAPEEPESLEEPIPEVAPALLTN